MFYILDNRTDNEVGSVYPQIDIINYSDAHKIEFDEFVSIPPLHAKLVKKAKLTDVLSQATISSYGILINEKVRNIFQQFNIIPHKYYPIYVQTDNDVFTYFWIQVFDDSIVNSIDYKNSNFYWKNPLREGRVDLISYNDYLIKKEINKKNISWMVGADKFVLNNSFNKDLDLFAFSCFTTNLFISERLKESLIKNRITGIDIIEAAISFE